MKFSKLSNWLNTISTPIIKEAPLFFITWFLAAFEPLRLLHGCIVGGYKQRLWLFACVYIGIASLFAHIFASIAHIWRRTWVKVLLYAIIIALFIINIFLQLNFGNGLTPQYVIIIGETNPEESSEFLRTFLVSKKGALVGLVFIIINVVIILLEKYRCRIVSFIDSSHIKTVIRCISLPFILLGICGCTIFISLFKTQSSKEIDQWGSKYSAICQDAFSRVAYSGWAPVAVKKEIRNAVKNSINASKEKLSTEDDSLNVVLIIGESYIKSHASLYGYYLNTTPLLCKESNSKNLFAFNDVISLYNSTSPTIKNLLACNSLGLNEQWMNNPYIPIIFKASGFKVYFWDNQKNVGDNTWDFTLNFYLHHPEIEAISYTSFNEQVFENDYGLVVNFIQQRFPTDADNFCMIHLWGQHVDPQSRYPQTKQWMHFTKDSITVKHHWLTSEMRQDIAEYDNATRYNDWVVSRIIEHYRNTNAVMVYLSDHGEEVYDWRPSKGRNANPMNKEVMKYQYQIPFMIWCSDKYKQRHPEIIQAIEASVNKPMSSDIVCNMLFHLAGIRTRYYRPQLDILSPQYHCPRRIVQDKYDYDKIMQY